MDRTGSALPGFGANLSLKPCVSLLSMHSLHKVHEMNA
jgi:hypothetical protein